MFDFDSKFSIERPYPSSQDETLQRANESDRGRIINSAAVRRLQQKTQVFPLERNAAVRSRLTHSLEVQQTGRFIVQTLCRKLQQQQPGHPLLSYERSMESMVEMACLMHDIGNPPFGHFGEAAISRWFAHCLPELKGGLSPELTHELANFEGNAQAIRLISNLQRLNLTYAQAASVLKYTRLAAEAKPETHEALSYLKKKPGYYASEIDYVEALKKAVKLPDGHRHPLTYLMEAADDISYCLADMEDGVDKNILSYQDLSQHLQQEFEKLCENAGIDAEAAHFADHSFAEVLSAALQAADEEPINKKHEFFVKLRVGFIHALVEHAADTFIEQLPSVFAGSLNQALLEDDSACHQLIKTLKNVAVRHIFSVPEVETLELQGYRIITGLLDYYRPLLELSTDEFRQLTQGEGRQLLLESRLYKRLPGKHQRAYLLQITRKPEQVVADAQTWELYCRCRLLQDMVSGMTDQFALDEFNQLGARAG
ncbi:dGTPase [Aliidiomarina minuta]|uniref:dGTPase n=1 Tax=Aliidiomarina minuta TaxID=880057 RepID=A0A432W3R7_9GAMM|nr:dGTPase [Aliidiomarina minuta]RUO23978.1 dGTPase [Aliidiomarina minuta]